MYTPRILPILVLSLLLAECLPALATPAASPTRPGTIAYAVSQADGTEVQMDAVIVDKIRSDQNPQYFVVHEWWSAQSRLIVLAGAPEQLAPGEIVDIQGVMGTLPGGERAVLDPHVIAYFDENGNLQLHGPVIKLMDRLTSWPWKAEIGISGSQGRTTQSVGTSETTTAEVTSSPGGGVEYFDSFATVRERLAVGTLLEGAAIGFECVPIVSVGSDEYGTYFIIGEDGSADTLKVYYYVPDNRPFSFGVGDRVSKVTGQVRSDAADCWLSANKFRGFDPQGYGGLVRAATCGTAGWAKTFADGTVFEGSAITQGLVTAGDSQFSSVVYVEDVNRGGAIRVVPTYAGFNPGDYVSVQGGTLSTIDGMERCITNALLIDANADCHEPPGGCPVPDPIRPVALSNRQLGGGSANVYTPGFMDYDAQGTPLDSIFVNNIGMLVTTTGKVTASGPGFIYIDDGSALDDGTGHRGIRIATDHVAAGNPLVLPDQIGKLVVVTGISHYMMLGASPIRVLRPRCQDDIVGDMPPTLCIGAPSPMRTTNGPVTYQITYSGADWVAPCESFGAYVTLETTGSATGSVFVSGIGNETRTVNIHSITGDGSIGIRITAGSARDSNGHYTQVYGPSLAFTVDNQPPTVSISPPSAPSSSGDAVSYTVTYGGASSVSLTSANVKLNCTGTAYGVVSVSGDGNTTRTVTISNIAGQGQIGISIDPGSAVDEAGNTAPGAGPGEPFGAEGPISVFVSNPSVSETCHGPVGYFVAYSGADTVTLSDSDVVLNHTETATGMVAVTSTEYANERKVTISNITGHGTLSISIPYGTASDSAGHMAPPAGPSAGCMVIPVVYVKQDTGSDSNLGDSWASAKKTLAGALQTAWAGSEIWVGMGTYEPITLDHDMRLYGGFFGNETSKSERDYAFYGMTIIDAHASGPGIRLQNLTSATIVDGFTIRSGRSVDGVDGGGILSVNSSAVISGNCCEWCDSGIYCQGGLPTISGNILQSNDHGIRCTYVYDCSSGYCQQFPGSPTITGNQICNNNSWSDGGGILCDHSTPVISGNSIYNNSADGYGAGVTCQNCPSVVITDNEFSGNWGYWRGSAIACVADGEVQISNNRIESNDAYISTVYLYGLQSATVANNLVIHNTADYGCAGIDLDNAPAVIANNTFADNDSGAGEGGAIRVQSGGASIANNIFYDNRAALGQSVCVYGGASGAVFNCDGFNPGRDNSPGTHYAGITAGSTYYDPMFENVASDDYHIQVGSSCIDGGDDSMVQSDWVDFDWEDRIAGAQVDIGADEHASIVGLPDPAVPGNVNAIATGHTYEGDPKVTLYWTPATGATGYNIYRGTASGQIDYQNPLNGTVPVDTESYPLSGVLSYTDHTGLIDEVTYYYAVKPVTSSGEGTASEEVSCTPTPYGIPWDTGDAPLILTATRAAFTEETIPFGSLSASSLDGRCYKDGSSTWTLLDGYVDEQTNTVVLGDGENCFAANAPAQDDTQYSMAATAPAGASTTLGTDRSGPFRRITATKHSYRGARGKISLPGAITNVDTTDSALYSNSVEWDNQVTHKHYITKDVPFVYVGLQRGKYDLEGGVCWAPWPDRPSTVYKWRLYMKAAHMFDECDTTLACRSRGQTWIQNDPNTNIFDGPVTDANMQLKISRETDGLVELRVDLPGVAQPLVMTHQFPGKALTKSAQGVQVRRLHSIAQNNLRYWDWTKKEYNPDPSDPNKKGYLMTGSYFLHSRWRDAQVWRADDTDFNAHWWGTLETDPGLQGSYPAKGTIVDWYTPLNSDETRYVEDSNVRIHL